MKTHEIKVIETMLEIYAKTNDAVSQEFYQGLCAKAIEIIKQLQEEISTAKKVGSFGFMIKKDETLQEGMARNYNEFDEERSRLQKELETAQKLLSDLEFRKDYESENVELRKLLQDFYDAEALLYQDYCCSDCDGEQRTIVENIKQRVKKFLKGKENGR